MNIRTLFDGARRTIDKRRRYNRLTTEILQMSDRDVADIGASRREMLDGVYREIYG